ncbi:UDP-N-acetylmuramoyl-tripeptide--D-alanyl-D-alanine ligase [Thermoflavimicrobium dichotomicum]|uniref:UDP-N-acetylmuramoyl-tripeptide--D-alanyl-D-alanine ligase n=1 Tax=Thermoflavimicrobium dichotomicum TaxID=46223 RepID=A0A1I3S0N2_9BACL|nr:UDP-N-acetylmuramoyl-tripeptide--D-alanyl-D-alanine ligase [Thermoflavimicrobium dichotomicum]SFJ51119.1 UDP-N-acetylmuramoyl-tripeptide--D-alanyl-D-alanine ligase [Thermoflavimicrobium dichotomicum]
MKAITLGKLAQIIEGQILSGRRTLLVHSVNFAKPKRLKKEQVYFYSKKVNWSRQLKAIRQIKPLAVVLPLEASASSIPHGIGIIKVRDPFAAYWKLAHWNWRQHAVKVIGITGSAGKSTTTAMVSSILRSRWSMVKTEGNLNTFTFLPDYLIQLKPHHKLLLLEMGMKSLNNIKKQCLIVKPHIGVVTNVGEAHVGSLGNLDIVVKAKQEIIDGMRSGGILFLNADDQRSRKLNVQNFMGQVRTFGIQHRAHIQGTNVRFAKNGMKFEALIKGKRYPFFIPTFGIHNVYNALAAIGVARAMGMSIGEIQKGLAQFRTPKMRLQLLRSQSNRLIINDAWNANPTAMIAGLQVLRHLTRQRPAVAVLGDMLELGRLTYPSHKRVGKYASQLKLEQLITIGKNARIIAKTAIANGMDKNKVKICSSHGEVVRHLLRAPKNAIIYFKGSRKLHLEKIVKRLKNHA